MSVGRSEAESLCLGAGRPAVRVARLSNVYGVDWSSPNFLPSLIRDAIERKRVVLRSALASAKDYVSVTDVVAVLARIAVAGRRPIYNVASGENTTHAALVERLAELTGCAVEVEPDAPCVRFPPVAIRRLRDDFGFRGAARVVDALADLVEAYRRCRDGQGSGA